MGAVESVGVGHGGRGWWEGLCLVAGDSSVRGRCLFIFVVVLFTAQVYM